MIQALEEAGLTKNEITAYTALLELGTSAAGTLTKKTRMHRSRVYEALDRLISKGLVSHKIKGNVKHFEAQSPEIIIDILEEKKKKVQRVIPKLKALQIEKPGLQKANVFEGYNGLKTVIGNAINILDKGEEVYIFGARSGQDAKPEIWRIFFKQVNKNRLQKGIKYKVIFNEDLRGSEVATTFKNSKLTEIKYINQHTPAGINIHGDNVAIVNWDKLVTFLITSKEVADSFKEYFKIMWKQAKK